MTVRVARQGFTRHPMERIYSETLSASGRFDITGIPQDYTVLVLFCSLRSDVVATSDNINLFLNGDETAANYRRAVMFGGTTFNDAVIDDAEILISTGASSPDNYFSSMRVYLPFYTGPNQKQVLAEMARREDANTMLTLQAIYQWEDTSAINQITIQPDGYSTDEFIVDSQLVIYGM